jgi:Cd2+/Zn2+-exporting ATPase
MKSEHPLAKAIVRRAQQQGVALRETHDLITYPGMGARATLDSSSASIGNRSLLCKQGIDVTPYEEEMKRLENDGKTVVLIHHHATRGIIALADTLREEAGTCIEQLRKQGIRHMVMLTGDNERVSSAIARQIRLDGFKAALLPEEKVDAIRELLFKYEKVAMVGDGVNDAPALAVSSVGIAMGAASTDTALESADIALMADDLLKLPLLVHLSRKTLTIIKTNIALALIVKAAFIMTVFLGWANLWMAVAADMGTSLLVILNGMRLMVTRPEASSTGYAPVEQRHHQSPCACNTDHQ